MGFAMGLLGALAGGGGSMVDTAKTESQELRQKDAETRADARQRALIDLQEQLGLARETRQNDRQDKIRTEDWERGAPQRELALRTGERQLSHMDFSEDMQRKQLALSAASAGRANRSADRQDALFNLEFAQKMRGLAAQGVVGFDEKNNPRYADSKTIALADQGARAMASMNPQIVMDALQNPKKYAAAPGFGWIGDIAANPDALAIAQAKYEVYQSQKKQPTEANYKAGILGKLMSGGDLTPQEEKAAQLAFPKYMTGF